jgi:riboflavin kinase/FMN adenylyltransferase
MEWDRIPISSTRIRAAIQNGHTAAIRAMLGRNFSLAGTVVHGRQVGRTLDCRTANVSPHLSIRPKAGVYIASLYIKGVPHGGAAFVPDSTDPTQAIFGNVVEIHLLNWNADLYGQLVEIEFHDYLRPFQKFDSPEALKRQFLLDIAQARKIFSHS